MKTIILKLCFCVAGMLLVCGSARSQTINWGSEVFSDLRDSNGVTLDEMYVFELGSFNAGFVPTEVNVGEWSTNWNVFDRAEFSKDNGYFTGTTQMQDDGTSTSAWQMPGATSFEGMEAYLWVRKGDAPVNGSEWLVARASNWIFPDATPGCCDNQLPTEWSVSDLETETPQWGSQGGVQGPGSYTVTGPHTLQTYTFVPEPSVALLGLVAGSLVLVRRRC